MVILGSQTLEKIANNCLGYDYVTINNCTSSVTSGEDTKSCMNCSHYYKAECQFGLIEKVLNKIKTM